MIVVRKKVPRIYHNSSHQVNQQIAIHCFFMSLKTRYITSCSLDSAVFSRRLVRNNALRDVIVIQSMSLSILMLSEKCQCSPNVKFMFISKANELSWKRQIHVKPGSIDIYNSLVKLNVFTGIYVNVNVNVKPGSIVK